MYKKVKKGKRPVNRFEPDPDAAMSFHKDYKDLVEKYAEQGFAIQINIQPVFDVYKDNEFKPPKKEEK